MNQKKLRAHTAGALAFAMLAISQLGMHATGSERIVLKLQLDHYASQMQQIHHMDLDVAGVNLKNKTVDLVVNSAEAAKLKAMGFRSVSTKTFVSLASPDAEYHTPAKVEADLKAFEAAYPDLAQVVSVGKSLEGRDIFAIKITSNVKKADPSKPHILFNGMHHAREVMSTEVPLDTINTLLTQYGKDPKVTHWVDANEIWVLPMFNVDGNNKVWTKDRMWRKNTRGGYGVDINRNYPYAWNSCNGSSSSQGAQDYHGPSGGSEPETQVMMNLVKQIRPVFSISYHSYSEIVIYPYGCANSHVPTKEVVEGIGAEIAEKILSDDHSGHYTAGTAPELLYSVDGGDVDWMYHEYQVIPFVIEVNSDGQGFQPSFKKWRDDTVARVKPGWQLLLDKLDGSSMHGQVKNSAGTGIAQAVLQIERTSGGAPFTQTYPAQANGFFDVIVPAGQYKVSVSAPGYKAQDQSVNVGTVRAEVNVQL